MGYGNGHGESVTMWMLDGRGNVSAKHRGKVPCPDPKFGSRHAGSLVLGIVKDAEHAVRKCLCYRPCHARKSVEEKVDRVSSIQVKRAADTECSVCPGIVMVQHIDKDNSKRPHVCGPWAVCRGDIVAAFVAHVRSTAAIHV